MTSASPNRLPAEHHHHLLTSIQSILVLITIAIFIVSFSAQPFRIPSASMEPTLRIGDILLVDRQIVAATRVLPSTAIRRGDVVVFHYPLNPARHLVKRVIGLPGDRVRLHGDHVFVNGAPLIEPYAVYSPAPPENFRDNFPSMGGTEPGVDSRWWIEMRQLIEHGELVIPRGRYFVLGDNRNQSDDSRYWGLVDARAIVGKPILVYFSLSQTAPGATAQVAAVNFRDRFRHLARWDRTLRVIH